jgi:hypothetical protein
MSLSIMLLAVHAEQAEHGRHSATPGIPSWSLAQEKTATLATRVWSGPDGNPLPFQSDEEVLEFLRTAKVMSVRDVSRGITLPQRVLLEKGGVRAHAHFNYVDEQKPFAKMPTGETVMNFRDSHVFQSAAYELARMLGLDNVPPVVLRRVGGRQGSLSIWIENTIMERERRAKKIEPPDAQKWSKQIYIMRVFDNLIMNTDRTQENMLIDKDWNLWMIDHTRAFRRDPTLIAPEGIVQCERSLWNKLQSLNADECRLRLKPYLKKSEIDGLLKRREKLVVWIQKLIQERGEDSVLYAYP